MQFSWQLSSIAGQVGSVLVAVSLEKNKAVRLVGKVIILGVLPQRRGQIVGDDDPIVLAPLRQPGGGPYGGRNTGVVTIQIFRARIVQQLVQCAANAGRTNKVPFVYRVHEAPDAEKMEKLSATLLACGLNAKFKNPIPTQLELAALLDETRDQPIQIPVHTGILRSMQKARYAPQPLGHYGLVLADYAHFTSPIRRYPDLAIHRILTDMLVGKPEQELIKDYTGFATHASEQSSRQEVSAVRIERDVEDLYKAEYMHNHLGEVYTGTVAGITPRGVFVELENTVEGFVPAAQLCKGEPQVIDGVSMLDPLTGKSWMLGSSMKIQVAAADVALGRIDFEYMVE